MDPPTDPPDDFTAEDSRFALILLILEHAMDLAASADRGARLAELADLDLFAQSALRAAAYASALP